MLTIKKYALSLYINRGVISYINNPSQRIDIFEKKPRSDQINFLIISSVLERELQILENLVLIFDRRRLL
jgi:hypothetical protein